MDSIDEKYYKFNQKIEYMVNKSAKTYDINQDFQTIFKEEFPNDIYQKLVKVMLLSLMNVKVYSPEYSNLEPDFTATSIKFNIFKDELKIHDYIEQSYPTILKIIRVADQFYAKDIFTDEVYYLRQSFIAMTSEYIFTNLLILPRELTSKESIIKEEMHAYILGNQFELEENLVLDIKRFVDMDIVQIGSADTIERKIEAILKNSYELLYIIILFVRRFYENMVDIPPIDPIFALSSIGSTNPNRDNQVLIDYVSSRLMDEYSIFYLILITDLFGLHPQYEFNAKKSIERFEQMIERGQLLNVDLIEKTIEVLNVYIDFLKHMGLESTEYENAYEHLIENIFIYKSKFQKQNKLQLNYKLSKEINRTIDFDEYIPPVLILLSVVMQTILSGEYNLTPKRKELTRDTLREIAVMFLHESENPKNVKSINEIPGLKFMHHLILNQDLAEMEFDTLYLTPRGFQLLCSKLEDKTAFLIQALLDEKTYENFTDLNFEQLVKEIKSFIDRVENQKERNLCTIYQEILLLYDYKTIDIYNYFNDDTAKSNKYINQFHKHLTEYLEKLKMNK